jgi:hypothetical protein
MIVKKLALGSACAMLVFAIGAVPPLLYAARYELYSQFNPKPWLPDLALSAILLTLLFLFLRPSRRAIFRGGAFGALAGLLASVPKQVGTLSAASMIADSSLWFSLFVVVEAWYVTVWGAAGAAIAWAFRCVGTSADREPVT